jgi:hypothetical protein
VDEVAVAVFATLPVCRGVTVSVTVGVEPDGRSPSAQVTVRVPEHLPWVAVADTNASWPASASLTVTAFAVDGPRFSTAIA